MDLLEIGRIFKAHGVLGEVKVIPETDDPNRFLDLETLFLGASPEAVRPVAVEGVRMQPNKHGITVLLRLEGVAGREAADALRGTLVFARAEDLPPLADDEVFLHDLIGLAVFTDTGDPIGHVRDVQESPAQPLYVVAREGRPDVLIPGVPAFVQDIDLDGRRLIVRPIEGLID